MNAVEKRSVRGGPAVERLLEAACQSFQLRNVGVLRGKSRVRAVSQARCYITFILRGEEFAFSAPEIGKILGGKNHSTVFYYIKTHLLLLKDESYVRRIGAAEAIREKADFVNQLHALDVAAGTEEGSKR